MTSTLILEYKGYILTRIYRDGHPTAIKISDEKNTSYSTLYRDIKNMEQAKEYVDELIGENNESTNS